jgi:hypothetical protein
MKLKGEKVKDNFKKYRNLRKINVINACILVTKYVINIEVYCV